MTARGAKGPGAGGGRPVSRSTAVTAASIVLMYVLGSPALSSRIGGRTDEMISTLRTAELNEEDATLLTRGYYENLIGVSRFNSQLWEVYMRRPAQERFEDTELAHLTGDYLEAEYAPSKAVPFQGAMARTNRWGLRDDEYERAKPPETFRLAVVGSSITTGWGVENDDTFEAIVERRLNQELAGGVYARFESLNFAVPGYTWAHYIRIMDKVLSFDPDMVLFVAHDVDPSRAALFLLGRFEQEVAIPYDTLSRAVAWAWEGAETRAAAERRLAPHRNEILAWLFHEAHRAVAESGALPVWVFLERLETTEPDERVAELTALAREAAFEIVDLSDAYDGYDVEAVRLSEWDRHPNPRGHRVVADRLYDALLANAAVRARLGILEASQR